MAENEMIEIHRSIYDRIVKLQGLLNKKYSEDKQFKGKGVTISDTLDFLIHEFYYYSWLREFLIELDRDGIKEIFEITSKYEGKTETARSLLHPFIERKEMNMHGNDSKWSFVFPPEYRIDQKYIKK